MQYLRLDLLPVDLLLTLSFEAMNSGEISQHLDNLGLSSISFDEVQIREIISAFRKRLNLKIDTEKCNIFALIFPSMRIRILSQQL